MPEKADTDPKHDWIVLYAYTSDCCSNPHWSIATIKNCTIREASTRFDTYKESAEREIYDESFFHSAEALLVNITNIEDEVEDDTE